MSERSNYEGSILHMALLAWKAGDITMIELKANIEVYTTTRIAAVFDDIYALSPTAQFKDWKPQDAAAFYERLKAYEAKQLLAGQGEGEVDDVIAALTAARTVA